jgi:hypothetical protein
MDPLRVVYVLTMNGPRAFEALSAADRAQLAATGKVVLGIDGLDETFAWLEREEMAFHKLRLVRGDTVEHDVWINASMDDGAVFMPETPEPNGLTISQESVSDGRGSRVELCAEVEAVLRAWRWPNQRTADETEVDLWQP